MSGEGKCPGFGRSPAGRPEEVEVDMGSEEKEGAGNEHEPEGEANSAAVRGADEVALAKVDDAAEHGQGKEDRPGEARERLVDDGDPVEQFIHDARLSVSLSALVLLLLLLCGFRGASFSWVHFIVFGVCYGALFCFEWIMGRGQIGEFRETGRGIFVESRQTIVLVGLGAVIFGSPGFLDMAVDVLVVAGVCGGSDDGRAVREVGRRFGLPAPAATWWLLRALWRDEKERP